MSSEYTVGMHVHVSVGTVLLFTVYSAYRRACLQGRVQTDAIGLG